MKSRRQGQAERKTERLRRRGRAGNSGATDSSPHKLVEQGQLALQNFQPDLALKFFVRAHEAAPNDTNIMDALADVHLQVGHIAEARALLEASTVQAPTVNCFKWLFLAQLQTGTDAVTSYQRAIHLMSELYLLQSEEAETRATGSESPPPTSPALLRKQITRAHVAIAELYLTDLCFEEGAEQLCSDAVSKALEIETDCLDALQCLASLRLSQGRAPDACGIIQSVYGRIMALRETVNSRPLIDELSQHIFSATENDEAPELEFCIQTAKILTECASSSPELADCAITLCSDLLEEDDENIEVWYIAGVAALSCKPVDSEGAMFHLSHARDMIDAQRESGMGGADLDEQYGLIAKHMEMLAPNPAANMVIGDEPNDDDALQGEEEW